MMSTLWWVPKKGGIILSHDIAYWLSIGRISGPEVLGIYAEKVGKDENGDMFDFTRGYGDLIAGKRAIVAEDVLNTGGSVKKIVKLVRAYGGIVIGVSAICNRGGVTSKDIGDVPKLVSLIDVAMAKYDKDSCPLCRQNVPINTTVGHGKKFLAEQVK